MKRKYKGILIVLALLVVCTAYGINAIKPRLVNGETLVSAPFTSQFKVQGTLKPERSIILNAPASGEIKEMPFQVGMKVESGTILAQIGAGSQTELEIQREQYLQQLTQAKNNYERLFGERGTAKSALETAKNDFKLAEKNYNNAKALAGEVGSVSLMELEGLKNQLETAKHHLLQMQEEASQANQAYYKELIASYEKQLEAMEHLVSPGQVVMPWTGTIWELYTEPGSYIMANQPVLKIYDKESVKIEVMLLAEDALSVLPGQMVACRFADGSTTQAEVSFLSEVAKQAVSTIGIEENRCVVELNPQEVPERIGAGYEVSITFTEVLSARCLTIPASALVVDGANESVYAIKGEKAVLTMVETGRKSSGRVEVLSGVSEGDIVIEDPYRDEIKDGARVKIN